MSGAVLTVSLIFTKKGEFFKVEFTGFTSYEIYLLTKAINQASYDFIFREKNYRKILLKIELMKPIEELEGLQNEIIEK